MEKAELEGHYERLKDELARAYSSPAWDSPHIDRLARELLAIERIASSSGAAPLSCPDSSRRPPGPAEVATR